MVATRGPLLRTSPLAYPASASPLLKEEGFGVVVEGVKDINKISPEEFEEIQTLLYNHSVVVFPDVHLTPAGQYALTLAFDPLALEYGHGKSSDGKPAPKSILHPDLKNIPGTPVQLIGNGPCNDPEILQGLPVGTKLKHPSHQTFHKSVLSDEESANGLTRFYRWHMDAALYERDPPKVTTLYGLSVPQGPKQTVRYDDGTGDELEVSLGGTSFVSGKIMFDQLSAPMKSLAIRTKVQYSPHPYVWMTPAKAFSTGLGIESDGLEVPREDLPPWSEDKIKTYPMVWKNEKNGNLHLQVHPSGIETLIIDPLPAGTEATPDALYPDGAHITDLKQVRELVYSMQRPGIAPHLVYTHDWRPNDLALFHNRGVLHTITGAFKPEEQRAFWQCNLASTDVPSGPTAEDVAKPSTSNGV
ncbi:alpha-ketoglutarate dependent xanthine dioxygenase [Pseudohyphozyma bogoriensis]|nr:alpha-ketoglutarate dependent xanthine dioxygenase [Pseudohyphozyma bogoriensis]